MGKNMCNNKGGFAVIEIMIVLAIIGILAAIAIPQFQAYKKRMENQPVRDTANLPTKGTTLTLKHLKEMKGQIVDTNSNILNEKWCIAVRYGKCVEVFPIEPGIYYDLDQGVNLPLKE